ncbi:hypothetical protein FACS189485_03290 [Spirochaetia bacterium]|nr:hypothetical protein FACS189485_03290 [Spirochaetia bacterium]GHV54884.1 hypothetical protein AGMMS49579_16350 [Spirochaetia bacterium]
MNFVGNGNADKISNNYKGMNDTGKKKLIQVAEQFLKIKNIVSEEKIIFNAKKENTEFKNDIDIL